MYSKRLNPDAISHRGLHDTLPENSIPAFLAAIEAGAGGIELDVHASADDVVFVHHDPLVQTEDGPTPLRSLDSRHVSQLRLAGETRIPTLDDTLEAIGSRARVFVEIKGSGIEHHVARCLRRHSDNIDAYAVHSFDHRIVKRMFELIPAVRMGILQVSYLLDTCAAMRAAGATDLWQHAEYIDASLVSDVHSFGGRVIAWTPNLETEWQDLEAVGVDAICTDRVLELAYWRSERIVEKGS